VANLDERTVSGFGDEWARFDQSELPPAELQSLFQKYFHIFPWEKLPKGAIGFDLGCGSGRWAALVAEKVGKLHCIDASEEALTVARKNLGSRANCEFHHASVDAIPLADNSMDFGYSLGVLHHVPDTLAGIKACVRKVKPGAPFLVYLYYRFDNRPLWFRSLWVASNAGRQVVSRLPHSARFAVSQAIAAGVYFPLARTGKILEQLGMDVSAWPLSFYRNLSFYTMRTDALDRFGTALEQRFTRAEIKEMLEQAGLINIRFSEETPHWVAVGERKS